MPRRIRQWWRAAIAAAAIMSPHAAAADQPLHAVQESESQPPQPQTTTNGLRDHDQSDLSDRSTPLIPTSFRSSA